jgi:ABC-type multidrug transport system permease subunit
MTNLQADSMIESGRPWNEVAPLFPTKIAAYEYFARSMTRRFASPDSHCAMCGRDSDAPPVRFTWRANVHTTKTVLLSFLFTAIALFAAHLYSRWVVVEFATFHRLCPDCQRRHRFRSIVIGITHKVLFALLMLLLFLTVPLIIFFVAMPFIAPEGTWRFLALSVIGVGLLALVMWAFEACRRSLIPHSLRQIGRFPFVLYDLHKTA